jgi:cell division protein FtsW
LKDILFRDENSLIGGNWYKLSKKLFVIPFILSFVGLLSIYSLIGTEYSLTLLVKHILYLFISIFTLIFISLLPINDLRKLLNILSILFIFLLLLVPLLGYEIKGAIRWINLTYFSIQPSEILKGPMVCMFSWFCYLYTKTNQLFYLFLNFLIFIIIITLLLLQPDIGTLLIYLSCFSLILILYIRKIKLFFLLGFVGISFIIIAYFSFDHVNIRINNFLFSDNLQVSKSLSAIKEGGLFGVGLGEGQLKYSIPESHNDFIFAILVEEFGLLFGLFIALLYPIFFIISKNTLLNSSNLFVQNTIFCLCFILCLQAFINIGSTIDLIPPTGMTLPFVSYGGSSMLSYALIFGTVICFSKNEENSTHNPS